MAETARLVAIDENSELAQILAKARQTGQPVILQVNGDSYEVVSRDTAADDLWRNYDPEKVRLALRRTAGALQGIDRDKLIADLRQQRAESMHRRA